MWNFSSKLYLLIIVTGGNNDKTNAKWFTEFSFIAPRARLNLCYVLCRQLKLQKDAVWTTFLNYVVSSSQIKNIQHIYFNGNK